MRSASIFRGDAPFVAWVAAPGPGAEARRIDQYPVESPGVALDPFVALAGQRTPLGIADPGAAQPARALLKPSGRHVTSDELAAVSHLGGERQGLASGSGAEIDDPHPGPGIDEECRDLRTLVLHLDEAVLDRGEAAERHPLREPQPNR